MVLSRLQPIANLLHKSGMSIHRVLHRFVANNCFYCHSFQSVIYKMLFWSTVISFIVLFHDISFIVSNCFAFWNGNDNSYEVKTNKRTNKQKNTSRKLFFNVLILTQNVWKDRTKFPWEHHELAWISSDYLLRGENDSKHRMNFTLIMNCIGKTIEQAKNYNHNQKP